MHPAEHQQNQADLGAQGFDRPGQVFRHTADASKAERLLGWTPSVSFDEGLERTIAWYRANVGWWRKQLWMRDVHGSVQNRPSRRAA